MVKGAGRKLNKTRRGGGRSFSNMVLDYDAAQEASRRKDDEEDDSDNDEDSDAIEEEGDGEEDGDGEEEEEEEEESGEEEEVKEDEGNTPGPSNPAQPEVMRVERRELKTQRKQAAIAKKQVIDEDNEDADLINPNHVQKKLNISDLGSEQLTRKEREAKEKQEAKDQYWKLHRAGKTQEAKSDLARLQKIREEREAAQAKRKAEAEAKAAEVEKKKAAMNGRRV